MKNTEAAPYYHATDHTAHCGRAVLGYSAGVHDADGRAGATESHDPLLRPFLRASDGATAQRCVEELLEAHARPVVREIVQRKVRRRAGWGDVIEAAADVEGEVIAQLLARLRDLRDGRDAAPIADFAAYAAVAAYHGCHRYVRALYPLRARLKNRVRYFLTHHASFGVWSGGAGTQVCGRRMWQGSGEDPTAAAALRSIRDAPEDFTRGGDWSRGPRPAGERRSPEGDLAAAILTSLTGPVDLDDLVGVIATVLGIVDAPPPLASASPGHASGDGRASDWESRIADPEPSVVTGLVDAERVRRLWQELLLLPVRQRAALLLNLRDAQGEGMIAWLPLTGVATMREIAAALEMPALEFAALWRELPVEDLRIAAILQVTRQQVINLRKCARERLARRLRGAS